MRGVSAILLGGLLAAGCVPVTRQLARPRSFSAGGPGASIAAADLNGDGRVDLVLTRASELGVATAGALAILLGRGDGSFDEVLSLPARDPGTEVKATIGDFDGDGTPDLAAIGLVGGGFVSLLSGNGDGSFRLLPAVAVGAAARSIKAGDFDGDGHLDLAVLEQQPSAIAVGGRVSVLLGRGDGSFDARWSRRIGHAPESVAVGDWNDDHHLDLAVTETRLGAGVTILWGRGDGSFSDGPHVATEFEALGASAPDLNSDGHADLLVGCPRGTLVYLGRGDGTFVHTEDVFVDVGRAASVADFNRDGIPDFVSGRRLALGDGRGRFVPFALPDEGYDDSSVVAADVNGDGWPDVVRADQAHGRIDVFFNRGR